MIVGVRVARFEGVSVIPFVGEGEGNGLGVAVGLYAKGVGLFWLATGSARGVGVAGLVETFPDVISGVNAGLPACTVCATAVDRYSTGYGLVVGVGARLEQPTPRNVKNMVERMSSILRII